MAAIAKVSTNTIALIILMLLLAPRVTGSYFLLWLLSPRIKMSFVNHISGCGPYDIERNQMEIYCTSDKFHAPVTLKPNPEASFTFYGGLFVDPKYVCTIKLYNSTYTQTLVAFDDVSYDDSFECTRERKCSWHLYKQYPFLDVPKYKKSIKKEYGWHSSSPPKKLLNQELVNNQSILLNLRTGVIVRYDVSNLFNEVVHSHRC